MVGDSRSSGATLTVETFNVKQRGDGLLLQADDELYPVQSINEYLNGERQAFFQDACRAIYNGSSSGPMHDRLQRILNEAINQGEVRAC